MYQNKLFHHILSGPLVHAHMAEDLPQPGGAALTSTAVHVCPVWAWDTRSSVSHQLLAQNGLQQANYACNVEDA